jgi:cobalt-zinc-cadmium efflux system outer membrane protein
MIYIGFSFMKVIHKQNTQSILICVTTLLFSTVSFAQSRNDIIIHSAPSQLKQLINQVLPSHPKFTAAQAKLDAVKAQYDAATNAIYNPEIELDGQKTTIQTYTVGLSQTIDWGDQQGIKTQIAKYHIDASQAKFKSERQQLIRDLLITIGSYQNTIKLAELSKQRLALMKNFFELARKKFNAGDLNQVEFDLAQLAYSESIFNNAKIFSDLINAEQTYYALYGSYSLSKTSLPDLSVDFKDIALPSDLDNFIMSLPQMRLVRANVAASKESINLRQSEGSADPTISIRGGKEDKESLVGISISMPLNVRNTFSAETEEARKDYLRTEKLAQQAWRDLRRDIISQTSQYQLTLKAWDQWKQYGQLSLNRQLNSLKRFWRAGDISTTDYLVQIKQNLDTQSAGLELQNTLWSSWLTWLESTAQIESWLQLKDIRNQ